MGVRAVWRHYLSDRPVLDSGDEASVPGATARVVRLDDLRNEAEALARELVRAAVRIEHLARLLDDEWRRCSGLRQRLAGIGREAPGTRHKERRR